MEFKALDAVAKRTSVRSYSDRDLSEEILGQIRAYCREITKGSFGAELRFKLVGPETLLPEDRPRSPGTYGVIRGARYYIIGAVLEQKGAFEDLGYCMEKIILQVTALDLGTCWLGGTFRRSAFAELIELAENEILPAVTPVGYPSVEKTMIDRAFRLGSGSKRRKPWDELFFGSDGTPLGEAGAGSYRPALEAVRLGPSASNRQPWRMVRDSKGIFHLYLAENKVYNRMLGKIRLQNIDMGIAMAHFELAASELGLPGKWSVDGPPQRLHNLTHIASWQ